MRMTYDQGMLCGFVILLTLSFVIVSQAAQNVSTTSSFKDTDVVTAIDQFEAGNLMANVSRPPLHNYTGVNSFSAPSIIHGFRPVYDTDAQYVSITTLTPPLPPSPPHRRKPGLSLFKKKKKRPPPIPIQSSTIPPQSLSIEDSIEPQQRIPTQSQFPYPPGHPAFGYPPVPPQSAFGRLTSIFTRHPSNGNGQQQWRPPQPPLPISTHYQGQNLTPGLGPGPSASPPNHHHNQGHTNNLHNQPHPQSYGSIQTPNFSRPPMSISAYSPPKTPHHRVSLNHYLQKISNMFSRSPHVPGYRPYVNNPQSPMYPHYYPLNSYAPHGQSSTNNPVVPQARRKKLRVKKPSADRRLDTQFLTGRPRATKETSNSDKPDTMEVKLHTGIHTESRRMLNRRLYNSLEPVFIRFKRDTGSGYRMPGIFGMDGGKPFYLDKDPNTGDITFTPNQQRKLVASNEVETNGTTEAGSKKKKPMPIIIHSYSSTKMQGQQRRPVNNKVVPKKPTFFYGNRTLSTLAPPRLPSFYPKVQSLSDYKNSMGMKTQITTITTTTTEPTTTTTELTTTTTTTTTLPTTTTTEEITTTTLKVTQPPSSTYPPGYDPYLPFDLLHLQTKKPEMIETPAIVQEIRPEDFISSFTPTGILQVHQVEHQPIAEEEIIGSVEAVALDYPQPPAPVPSETTLVTEITSSVDPIETLPIVISGIEPTPWIPLESTSVSGGNPIDTEVVTEPDEYYDYEAPPQQPPPGPQFPQFYNPYNPQGPPNSFNSFAPQGQPPHPPWYYPPPGQQPFYPPWGPYPNTPSQFPNPQQPFIPSQPPMVQGGPTQPQPQPPTPPQLFVTQPPTVTSTVVITTVETTTTVPTTTVPPSSTTTLATTTLPQPQPIETTDEFMEEFEDQSLEADGTISVEKPFGPGFNPVQLPTEIHSRPGPPQHFRPPPNFRPPYGPPPPNHPFNRPGMYPPPPPFVHPHRQNFPFRPPPPVGELIKNRPPQPPVEMYMSTTVGVPTYPTTSTTTTTESPQEQDLPMYEEEPMVVVQMLDKLNSYEVVYSSIAPIPTASTTTTEPTTTTITTTPKPTTTTPIPTTTTTTTPIPTTTSTTTPIPTTTIATTTRPITTTTTTTPRPTTTTTTTQKPTTTEPSTTTTTTTPVPTTIKVVQTEPPQVTGPASSAEYETYYEDYPDEPTVMYNPYNNAQGQYYSATQQNHQQMPQPVIYEPQERPREPLYGNKPSIVTSDLIETAYKPQDSLMIDTNPKGQGQDHVLYDENVYQYVPPQMPEVTTTTTTTQRTTTTTTKPTTTATTTSTTTQPPPPAPTIGKIEFKPSQVDNFFISAEQILNEPGSLSTILQNDEEEEEEPLVLPNILPQFRPNANVDPSERLPLYGDEKRIVQASAERIRETKVPEGPVEIPQQSIEEYEEEEEIPRNQTDNQEITGMFPPAIHPPMPFPPRPPTTASFLSNLFYGNKRGPPPPPHVMIGYGNETMRPPWGHHQPPPGHLQKFPPGQFPHGQFPPNAQYSQGLPPQGHGLQSQGHGLQSQGHGLPPQGHGPPQHGQGIPHPLPSSIHFPGQGPPPNIGGPPQPPPGFFQQGSLPGSSQGQGQPPTQPPQMKYSPGPLPTQNQQPIGNQGRPPHLIHGPPPMSQGMPPQQFHNQIGQPHPNQGQATSQGFYAPGPPPQGQGHFHLHPPPNGKFLDDNQLKRNGQRPLFPPPPPGFFRGPPPPNSQPPHANQNQQLQHPHNAPQQIHNPPHPQSQQIHNPPHLQSTNQPITTHLTSAPTTAKVMISTVDHRARLDTSATSSEEVIYVTQEELEKLKQNGQGDEFVEYSDEVEVPINGIPQGHNLATAETQTHPQTLPPPPPTPQALQKPIENQPGIQQRDLQPITQTQQPIIQTQQPVMQTQQPIIQTQQPIIQTQQPIIQTQQPNESPQHPIMLQETHQPITQENHRQIIRQRQAYEADFQPSAPPPIHHQNFHQSQETHNFLPSPPIPQPQPNFKMQQTQHQQHHPQHQHHHYRPPEQHPQDPKMKPSQPMDYDDLITGPLVDITRGDNAPRDIIVKSSFSHDGGSQKSSPGKDQDKSRGSGWQGAVEKVSLDDSIKFMLPGGAAKASGSIQWGGFQPIN